MEAASTASAAGDVLSSAANDVETSQNIQPETHSEPRKYRIKVDGQELEVDENELKKGYQLSKAAHKRMQEAAAERKRLEPFANLITNIRQNPAALFELAGQLGVNQQQLKDAIFGKASEFLEYDMLSPEQREAMEMKKELQRYKQAEEEAKRQEEQRTKDAEFNKACIAVENEFCDFIESLPEKPDHYTMAKMADYRLKSFESDYGPWTWQQAYDRAIQDQQRYEDALRSKLTADKIPEHLRTEMRKADVQKVRSAAPKYRKASDTQSAQRAKPRPQKTDDFFKKLEDRFR